MKRRARTFLSFLALVALAHASWQWVRTAPCAPSVSASAAETATPAAADHRAGGAHAGADHRPADAGSSHCPLGPMGIASGCAGAAPIPSHVTFGLALPARASDPLPRSAPAPQPLFGADIFRPPRA